MGIFNKLIKRGAGEVDDDLELEDEPEDPVDSPKDEGGSGPKMLGWIRNRRKKEEEDDEELWENPDEEPDESPDENPEEDDGGASGESEDAAPVQVVRLEGVPDVHPVGNTAETSMPMLPQPGGAAGTTPASQSQSPSTPEASAEAGAVDPVNIIEPQTEPQEEANDQEKDAMGGLGLSLKGIFEEEQEVDESLRDLADSMDDVTARELADDLKSLLEGLESRMG